MTRFLHYSMGIAAAVFLSRKPPTPRALSFAKKVSKLMVQRVEHVRLITNGMGLLINVKVSWK